METQITRPVEDAMAGLSNVESIVLDGDPGRRRPPSIQFELGEDLQKATDDVRSKVDQTRAVLPREIDPPIVQRIEIDDAARS